MLGKSLSKSLFPLSFELFLLKKGSVGNTGLLLPPKMLRVPLSVLSLAGRLSSVLFSQNKLQYKNTYKNCKLAKEPRRNQKAYEAWVPQSQRNK